jgi:hypothetical protein
MKKQIFTIILLLMGGVSAFGQFKFDGGVNSVRLQTNGVDRVYVQPSGINSNTGSVGINTINPDAKLTINGDMSFKNITRFTTNGGYTAANRNGASVLIFEAGGVLNGIASGVDGMLLYVLCGYKLPTTVTTGALIIKHEESVAETVPANRIMTHTGADFNITTGTGGVMMIYDGGRQRWRIMEVTSGSGSFSGWGLTGNVGTTPATDFMGTTDAQPLVVKTNNVERMRILSTGNVGINAVPDINAKLIISKGASGVTSSSTFSTVIENNSGHHLGLFSPDGTETGITFGKPTLGRFAAGIYSGSASDLNFYTGGDIRRMTIKETGNVGIGTTTPDAKLDVLGDVRYAPTNLAPSANSTLDPLNRNNMSYISINATAGVITTINGISAPSTPTASYGTMVYISAGSGATVILKNNAAAVATNSIQTYNGADVTITGRGGAYLIYDVDGWRFIGGAL